MTRASRHGAAEHLGGSTIVWNPSIVSPERSVDHLTARRFGRPATTTRTSSNTTATTNSTYDARFLPGVDGGRHHARSDVRWPKKWVENWLEALSRPTFGQLHGGSPIETTRFATTSGAEAADMLDHTTAISWDDGRDSGRLLLEPFRAAAAEFGRPWIADATLHGVKMRRLRVSVAIFDHGTGRCGIQIRPGYRRPWSSRRLRRCLRSTHSASHRLRELVLAVDFTPPGRPATRI